MLDYYLERLQERGTAFFYGLTLGGGTLLLFFSGWLWWHYFYLNPQTVFYSSVDNGLVTTGVTKQTVSKASDGSVSQDDQITLGAQNLVKTVTVVTQTPKQAAPSVVTTEAIGTPDDSFIRYSAINAGKTTSLGPVAAIWSKQPVSESGSGVFENAIFDVFPVAHLPALERQKVMDSVKKGDIYKTDFKAVTKERKNGRLYYIYNVSLVSDKYAALLKQVDAAMGLNKLKTLDPSQYQGSEPVLMRVKVDAAGHQLQSVSYVANNRVQTYSVWGASRKITVPTKSVTPNELQAKLNAVLNQQ